MGETTLRAPRRRGRARIRVTGRASITTISTIMVARRTGAAGTTRFAERTFDSDTDGVGWAVIGHRRWSAPGSRRANDDFRTHLGGVPADPADRSGRVAVAMGVEGVWTADRSFQDRIVDDVAELPESRMHQLITRRVREDREVKRTRSREPPQATTMTLTPSAS